MTDPTPPTSTSAEVDPSIIDTILDLDAYLSADVRRAEKTAPFSTKPHLEAQLDVLDRELQLLAGGNSTARQLDEPLGAGGRTARVVAQERQAVAAEMLAAMKGVRFRALSTEDWEAFEAKHKQVLDNPEADKNELLDELIVLCAVAPAISAKKLVALKGLIGITQTIVLRNTAWDVNTKVGVSVPKSQLSSDVLRHAERARS
jgi:hypothetical protein